MNRKVLAAKHDKQAAEQWGAPCRTEAEGLKMNGEIERIEVLGPESLVHLHLPGVEETIIAKVDTDPSLPVSGAMEFEVSISDLHSFAR